MSRDLVIVLFSALIATLNPSLLAAVAVMLLLPHPKRLMLAYLLGAYTSSIASGLAIVFSFHGSSVATTSTHLLSPTAEITVGVVALAVALMLAMRRGAALSTWRKRRKKPRASDDHATKPWQTRALEKGSVGVSFAVGAALSFPGASYIDALGHIARLNPPVVPILLLIVYLCVMQQILLEGALVASVFAGERTQDAVVRLKGWFTRHGRQLGMIGLAGIGTFLAARGLLTIG